MIIAVVIVCVRRHYGICLKSPISEAQTDVTSSSRVHRSEYDEVVAGPPNPSTQFTNTYANIPANYTTNNDEGLGNTEHSGYENLELLPQSQPYETLAIPSQSQNYENMKTEEHKYESLAKA